MCLVVSDSLWLMDCSPPGSSVHRISQARILESVVIFFSSGSSWTRDKTMSLASYVLVGRFFTTVLNGIVEIFAVIMAENCSKVLRNTKLQIQESREHQAWLSNKKSTLRHVIIKLPKKKKKTKRSYWKKPEEYSRNLTYRGAKDDNYIGIFFENRAS